VHNYKPSPTQSRKTVLKITLLNTSRFELARQTNKKNEQKKSHFSSTVSVRWTIPTKLVMTIDEIRPIWHP